MRLFKITNFVGHKPEQTGWVLCTDSIRKGVVCRNIQSIHQAHPVSGHTPWKEWLAKVTILSECKASTISDLLAQIPEEFI